MGMYNEVFAKCDCGAYAEIQIAQIVLGFGGFYLDRPSTMEELSTRQKRELADAVKGRAFQCQGCGYQFNVQVEVQPKNTKKVVI